jgi:hypothetical protein
MIPLPLFEEATSEQAAFSAAVDAFLDEVADEVFRAREKFPSSDACVVALVEEVGELAKACLSESRVNILKEARQVAAMAVRVVLEGDPSLENYRKTHDVQD